MKLVYNTPKVFAVCCWVALVFLSIVSDASGQTIIYVNQASAAGGNGAAWATAYNDLQQALTAASGTSGSKQIWVARGEYKPTISGGRAVSFVIPGNTILYGGFAGGETSITARNWRANRTILSGDLGVQFDKSDNSYHVVLAKDVDSNSGVDGFIVKYGNANGGSGTFDDCGGGMLIVANALSTAPAITNVEFSENEATGIGGGLATVSGGAQAMPAIVGCFFNGNTASKGGGAGNYKITGENETTFINNSFSTNRAGLGGAVANVEAAITIVNNTFSKNSVVTDGGAVYSIGAAGINLKNSILWKNFKGGTEIGGVYNQLAVSGGASVVQHNIVQGGFGVADDQNIDQDPLFVEEPSGSGKYPRTSIIPSSWTEPRYGNRLDYTGDRMNSSWAYYTFKDHAYNKLYISGSKFQVIDFNNLTNGRPTSRVYSQFNWGRIQSMGDALHEGTNKIYAASYYNGVQAIDRATGEMTEFNLLQGEPISYFYYIAQHVVIDNDLLYCPVMYSADGRRGYEIFYGIVELNLVTNAKRWINTTSTPVAIPEVFNPGDDAYWNGHRLCLDKINNILYYSCGKGVWWWNRGNNATGMYSAEGGIPLKPGSPSLPSNLTTAMYMDQSANKLYIGTHEGLFVWNKNDNTSKVYDKTNSVMIDNLIDHIEENEELNLIYVACENGGVFELNSVTGEQRLYKKDEGSDTDPQLTDTYSSSAHYDAVDKKLYVSTWAFNGGTWVKDYNNLLPDFGDLSLSDNSPALDRSDETVYPAAVIKDINGSDRFVNYAAMGANSLDLGAYEKTLLCQPLTADFQFERSGMDYVFTPILNQGAEGCSLQYQWTFGDGVSSSESSPKHTYAEAGTFPVSLKVSYVCGECAPSQVTFQASVTVESLCTNIFCNEMGMVGIGAPLFATGYRLSVAGKIVTEGAQVMLKARWPDYVFNDSYRLMSMAQLRKYIEHHRHLPNVPSAEAMRKSGGVDAGEMSAILMEKVEELTLHLIQLDERLKKMEVKK